MGCWQLLKLKYLKLQRTAYIKYLESDKERLEGMNSGLPLNATPVAGGRRWLLSRRTFASQKWSPSQLQCPKWSHWLPSCRPRKAHSRVHSLSVGKRCLSREQSCTSASNRHWLNQTLHPNHHWVTQSQGTAMRPQTGSLTWLQCRLQYRWDRRPRLWHSPASQLSAAASRMPEGGVPVCRREETKHLSEN